VALVEVVARSWQLDRDLEHYHLQLEDLLRGLISLAVEIARHSLVAVEEAAEVDLWAPVIGLAVVLLAGAARYCSQT
jgi:hypothetical protein